MMRTFVKDNLNVEVYDTREEMGKAAARDIVACLQQLLEQKEHVNMIFAAAPSQNEVLAALAASSAVDWRRVNAFHMDEYIGLDKEAPQGFGNFLKRAIFDKVQFKAVYCMQSDALDAEQECKRYTTLLQTYPADLVCMGIGENTHIAFNDPHVADFNDPVLVKVVDLDEQCRQQQVNDGCFAVIGDVPKNAITLTVPALMHARFAFCVVPGPSKAKAVFHTMHEEIQSQFPSTILRKHDAARMYLDAASAVMLD